MTTSSDNNNGITGSESDSGPETGPDSGLYTKTYNPSETEDYWYARWIEAGLFTANPTQDVKERAPYTMVIPPPNITGSLHLGHALNNTLQDIMARFKRMTGHNVLWVPGIDHAGIATQNVVERQLHDQGLDRHKIGREEFIKRVWKWKIESGGTIINQLKRLGASCDWSRERFTMDEGLSKAVKEVFVKLYNEELIYQGDYIINWCPRCHTALSDIEVEAKDTPGHLWNLIYKTKDGDKSVTVATTRPETMLGDTAVAVNPDDERYTDLIGKTLVLPLVNREVPVIADPEVDMEFGTGAVKITPAHDFNDFDMATRHNLPFINIMNIDGRLNEEAGSYNGLDRFDARKKVVEDLKAIGQLGKIEKYNVRLGSCYRCHTVVEPRLSKQWFVKVAPLAGPAIKAVEDGEMTFVPKSWENTYFEWMRNIRDWCISRQIWWGHRIPAWHCSDCSHITVAISEPTRCGKCDSTNITQDPDVLDTWFSSALWPFSTLGWPETTDLVNTFYPTSSLFTSFDIIFFWVARMMMMGIKFMDGRVPFKEVYIHALIRDEHGQKMSKSKGNSIDPLVMMDKFGTDALRFTLAAFAAQGRDIKLAEDRIEGYRNFTNKIWNLARFADMYKNENDEGAGQDAVIENYSTADKWIITKLKECQEAVEKGINTYRFDIAAKALYGFIWHELCDWYVELIKPDLRGEHGEERKRSTSAVLTGVVSDTMKLLHPFMPFITEEIYSKLPCSPKDSKKYLMQAGFPVGRDVYPTAAKGVESVIDIIRTIRNIKTEMNITPTTRLDCVCYIQDETLRQAVVQAENYLKSLGRVEELTIREGGQAVEQAAYASLESGIELYIPLKGHVDVRAETKRLEKNLEKLDKELSGMERKLGNENFIKKAPPEVVEKDKKRVTELKDKKAKLCDNIERVRSFA